MAQLPVNAYWRDSARSPRFFFMDAYAALPFVVLLLHIRLWTFILAIPVFKRWLRTFIGGSYKFARPWWRYQ